MCWLKLASEFTHMLLYWFWVQIWRFYDLFTWMHSFIHLLTKSCIQYEWWEIFNVFWIHSFIYENNLCVCIRLLKWRLLSSSSSSDHTNAHQKSTFVHYCHKVFQTSNIEREIKIIIKKSKRKQPPPHLSCSPFLLYMAYSMKKQALRHLLHKLPPISPLYKYIMENKIKRNLLVSEDLWSIAGKS